MEGDKTEEEVHLAEEEHMEEDMEEDTPNTNQQLQAVIDTIQLGT